MRYGASGQCWLDLILEASVSALKRFEDRRV